MDPFSNAAPAPLEFARIKTAVAVSGLSRSAIYVEAKRGNIRIVKHGKASLVDMASVRRFLASLPAAALRGPDQHM